MELFELNQRGKIIDLISQSDQDIPVLMDQTSYLIMATNFLHVNPQSPNL